MQQGDKVECIQTSVIRYWDRDGRIQDSFVSKQDNWDDKSKRLIKREATILVVDKVQGNYISFVGKYFFHKIERFKVLIGS